MFSYYRKVVEINDLKAVLSKWNLTHVNQCMFLEEFTRRGEVHVDDMIERMKDMVRKYYAVQDPVLLAAQAQDDLLDTDLNALPFEALPRQRGDK